MTDERTAAAAIDRATAPVPTAPPTPPPPDQAPRPAAEPATPGPALVAPPEPAPPEPAPVALADPATAAALADVLAARAALGDELIRLEASARAAVDVKAKVRRNPGKTAAVVGGTAFVVAGGPRRVFRAARRRVFGAPDPLPPSLLPDQVDKAVRALGDDGAKVRGALEREFADFVSGGVRAENRFRRRLVYVTAAPIASTLAREIAKRVTATSGEDIARREEAIRARVEGTGPSTR